MVKYSRYPILFSMWLFVALLGNTMLAIVGILDKFILTKSVSKPVVFVFYSTIFVLPFFLLLPFGVKIPTAQIDYLIFAVYGFCFALGLWTMYIGFQKSEISHIGPLIGAAAPFFILFLSRVFLGEQLTSHALLGAIVLIIGSLIISFNQNTRLHHSLPEAAASLQAGAKHFGQEKQLVPKGPLRGWRGGMCWGVLAGFLFAVSHVAAKHAYDAYGFYNGFIFTKLPIGIFGAALLLTPSVRALFYKKEKTAAEKSKSHKQFAIIAVDMGLGVAGSILLQYAMALGSVSLVNALAGVQYAMLIVLVAVISKFFPRILKETFTKKEIIQKVAAVSMISAGLFLLLVK